MKTDVDRIKGSTVIAVLMGGPSQEHDISLKSGRGVADALVRRGWTVQPVLIPSALGEEEARDFVRQALTRSKAKAVFIALHGRFGEDGTVQQLCEEIGLPYTGSDARASSLGIDKIASRERFVRAGLHVPTGRVAGPDAAPADAAKGLAYPLIVKPADQGSSIGISIAAGPADLQAALDKARQYGSQILVEEFIRGREVTVGVMGDRALPVVEIVSTHAFFDFEAKYTVGMTTYQVPALLSPAVALRVQEAGLAAHQAVGCRHFSRTDFILNERQEPVVLEVNTIPGFTKTSLLPKAAANVGISYEELCEQLVLMAWNDQEARQAAVAAPEPGQQPVSV